MNDTSNTDNNAATTTTTNDNQNKDGKVTFDERQQKHLDEVVLPSRLKREREKLTRELTETLTNELTTKLTTELSAKLEAEHKKSTSDDSELMRQRAQMRAALEGQKREAEEKQALKEEIASIRKRAAMDTAMADLFVNKDVVAMMTDNPAQGVSIELDSDSGEYVVRENGVLRITPSLTPMSLQEYYAEFAARNSYLAAGTTKGGTGSAESRSSAPQTREVRAKSDLKNNAAKIAFIKEFGYQKFAALPLKRSDD